MKYIYLIAIFISVAAVCVSLRTETNLILIDMLRGNDPAFTTWWLILILIVVASVGMGILSAVTYLKKNNS